MSASEQQETTMATSEYICLHGPERSCHTDDVADDCGEHQQVTSEEYEAWLVWRAAEVSR